MDQSLRFLQVDGKRVAYATVGDGPPLLVPAWWVSHLELEWEYGPCRSFFTALAADRTVVRWNGLGIGLSERDVTPDDLTIDAELRTLAAVADRVGAERFELLGISALAATSLHFAAMSPERVERIMLWGAYADGSEISTAEVRRSMVDVVKAHWGLGSRVLADVFVAGADAEGREVFARVQREAATPEVASVLLQRYYERNVRALLPKVTAPVTVLHRRDDRAVPYALGVDVAASLPDAQLVTLDGEAHAPWYGDAASVLRALGSDRRPAPVGDDAELSDREREVLALVAAGLSDAAIAEKLVLSPHTVHRHVANIRVKLNQPSRAAAAAHAIRLKLI